MSLRCESVHCIFVFCHCVVYTRSLTLLKHRLLLKKPAGLWFGWMWNTDVNSNHLKTCQCGVVMAAKWMVYHVDDDGFTRSTLN